MEICEYIFITQISEKSTAADVSSSFQIHVFFECYFLLFALT